MNKQAIARLAPKFEGYQIVGLSADEMHAVLVNSAGETFSYTFDPADNGEVLLARVKPVTPVVTFAVEDGVEIHADLADIIFPVACAAKNDAGEAADLRQRLESAEARLDAMRLAEHQRRIDLIKSSVAGEMARIQANEPEICEGLAGTRDRILENAENFANMEEDGKFCGDAGACAQLRSKAMELHLSAAEEAARNEAPAFVWDAMSGKHQENGGIGEMLAFIKG